jgi:hypothetical protein
MTKQDEIQQRIAERLRQYWAGRPAKLIESEDVSNGIAAMAMEIVGPELDRPHLPPDANNLTLRTTIEDDQCFVHLDELIDWLERQKIRDCPAEWVAARLREAGQLWTIAQKEGFR